MGTEVRHEDDVTVVCISGRFDAPTAPEVKEQLQELIESGHAHLVVNLADIELVDSAGLGVLVSCLRRAAAAGGNMCLAEVPSFCRSVFELTRLTRVFDVDKTEAEAIEAVRASGQGG